MLKNKFIYSFFIFAICACNFINEDERLLDYEPPISDRNVLLEEYTGQYCINCPKGAAEAKRLQEAYNHKVIVIGIHAGGFAAGTAYVTDAGEAYREKFYSDDIMGYPVAMINRSNGVFTIVQGWSTPVANAFQIPTYITLSMKANYNVKDSILSVVSTMEKLTIHVNNKTKLLLMLTENKIIDFQLSKEEGYIAEYEHNHVLRGVIGDQDEKPNYWGEEVEIAYMEGTEVTSASYKLNENWKPENMNIVGILYDVNTYEVLQVEEIPLMNNN